MSVETKKQKVESSPTIPNNLPAPKFNDSFSVFPHKGKYINDPVHGYIQISEYCLQFVDTPQFQRLRELKQLGTSYFVFPGASHARFEHCLGVCYLSRKWLSRLKEDQPELHITDNEIDLVSLAGLCHDLGHGPFSHSFEHMVKRIKGYSWSHEQMSQDMFDYLIDDNNIDIDQSHIKFVKDLIDGKPSQQHTDKLFLFDIVSNSKNSIDVDKFDYLSRDCYNLGIKSSWDYNRLMKFSRVIDDEICFHSKEVYNVYEMFHTRYSMHKQVYSHRVGGAIESMISDALAEAQPYLGIFDSIHKPEQYMYLTDSILNKIESSRDENLKKSQEIIRNMRKRNLYKLADEVLVPEKDIEQIEGLTEAQICKFGRSLRPEDITLRRVVMNYALKKKNPVDHTHFFTNNSLTSRFSIPKKDVSLLIPDQFSETYLRIYVKNSENLQSAQDAFRNYLNKNTRLQPSPAYSLRGSSIQEDELTPMKF